MRESGVVGNGRKARGAALAVSLVAAAVALSGCNGTRQVITHGAIVTQEQIDLIPVGSSRDQVLLAVGSPSTTGSFDNEVYYYITQRKERNLAFQRSKLVDQRVLAVYFDETDTVARVANYGLQDGRLFDFISRTTPTGGKDLTFLQQLLQGTGKPSDPIQPLPPSGQKL
jgi:outer membrane protein assembly factor BamE (lipoprotein component of BamABCDE complex)